MKNSLFALVLALAAALSGCRATQTDTVAQVSTIDAILAGAYDGQMTCAELLGHGDFGIGTFHGLDGEMIVLDGTVYQVKADGRVYTPPLEITTPFACVAHFRPERTQQIPGPDDMKSLQKKLDALAPDRNLFCAVRVTGRFARMKMRSVPAQTKPYPPLTEVTKNQPVFERTSVAGTLVGFRCPKFVKGINVGGYHLHFLSDDRTSGGHVLDFTLENAVAEVDLCHKFFLVLPKSGTAFATLDLTKDRTKDLHKAER